MGNFLTSVRGWLGRKAREEDGTATIPFIIFLPFFMTLVMSSLEAGTLMLRHVMLERALDLSVRDLRLGLWTPPPDDPDNPTLAHDEFRRIICNRAGVIPNCTNALLVELRPVSTATWAPLSSGATCINRAEPILPADMPEFVPGEGDEIMLIRVCAKFSPVFPMTGLGLGLPEDDTGAYALVSMTTFVNEPELGS